MYTQLLFAGTPYAQDVLIESKLILKTKPILALLLFLLRHPALGKFFLLKIKYEIHFVLFNIFGVKLILFM